MFDYAATIRESRRRFRADGAVSVLEVRHSWGNFLNGMDGTVTSQNGEDGLIAALFDKIGTRNRWCFEVGAADGMKLSNTWVLRQASWKAVLIEADDAVFAELARGNRTVICVHERIGLRSLDRILAAANAPRDLDFGVIDIDGQDLPVWNGLEDYRPRVVMIEYNAGGDGVLGGVFERGEPVWQAGYESIARLGRSKGYEPVATTGHNAFFVTREAME